MCDWLVLDGKLLKIEIICSYVNVFWNYSETQNYFVNRCLLNIVHIHVFDY